MGEFPTIERPSSSPISEDALLSNRRTEGGPTLPLVSYDQNSTYLPGPTYATSQRNFNVSHLQFQEPFSLTVQAERQPTILHSQAHPPISTGSAWNDTPSRISYAPFSFFPTEGPTYHTQQAPAVVTNSCSTSTSPHEPEREKTRLIFPFPRIHAPPHGPAATASPSHPEHVTQWYRVRSEAVVVHGPREFIPQKIYEPNHEGDRRRYVSHANLHPPIIFLAEYSLEWGIPVPDLLPRGSTRVAGGNELAFTGAPCGPSICIRVHWPGYQPFHKKLLTTDYTSERGMIKKERLAKVVARYVSEFMNRMSKEKMQVGSDSQWKIGPFGIRMDDIILVSLHHVSKGSWQPQLRLRRVIETNTRAGQYYVHGCGGEAGEVWA